MNFFQKRFLKLSGLVASISLTLLTAGVATFAWYQSVSPATPVSQLESTTITTLDGVSVERYDIYKYDFLNSVGKKVTRQVGDTTFDFNLPKYDKIYSSDEGTNAHNNVILRAEVAIPGGLNSKLMSLNIEIDTSNAAGSDTLAKYLSNVCQFKSVIAGYKTDINAANWTPAQYPNNPNINETSDSTIYSSCQTYFNARRTYTTIVIKDSGNFRRARDPKVILSPILPKTIETVEGNKEYAAVEAKKLLVYIECSYNEDLIDHFSSDFANADKSQAYDFAGDINRITFSMSSTPNGGDASAKYIKVATAKNYKNNDQYLLVNEKNKMVLDQSLGDYIATNDNYVGHSSNLATTPEYNVVINEDYSITPDDVIDTGALGIDVGSLTAGSYPNSRLKMSNGDYIYSTGSDSNINHDDGDDMKNDVSLDSKGIATIASGGRYLQLYRYTRSGVTHNHFIYSSTTASSDDEKIVFYKFASNFTAASTLKKFEVTSFPNNGDFNYYPVSNGTFDTTGFSATATYWDGSTDDISNVCTFWIVKKGENQEISPKQQLQNGVVFSLSEGEGDYTVEVQYIEDGVSETKLLEQMTGNKYPSFVIHAETNPIVSISITKQPASNTAYLVGDTITASDFEVTAHWTSGPDTNITTDTHTIIKISSTNQQITLPHTFTAAECGTGITLSVNFQDGRRTATSNAFSVYNLQLTLDSNSFDYSKTVIENKTHTISYTANRTISWTHDGTNAAEVSPTSGSWSTTISCGKDSTSSGTFSFSVGDGNLAETITTVLTATISNGTTASKSISVTIKVGFNSIKKICEEAKEQHKTEKSDFTFAEKKTFTGVVTAKGGTNSYWVQDPDDNYAIYCYQCISTSLTNNYKYTFTEATIKDYSTSTTDSGVVEATAVTSISSGTNYGHIDRANINSATTLNSSEPGIIAHTNLKMNSTALSSISSWTGSANLILSFEFANDSGNTVSINFNKQCYSYVSSLKTSLSGMSSTQTFRLLHVAVAVHSGTKQFEITNSTTTEVALTGISIPPSLSIAVGATNTLDPTFTPSNATNKGVTWSSSNTNVATVSGGTVTGVAVGSATITVTSSANNSIKSTCTVTVTAAIAVTGVTLNKSSTSIAAGGTETLTATVSPSNATNKNVTWSTSNPSVATVSNGTVTGVAAGSATITVTTVDGSKTATCNVSVTAPSYDEFDLTRSSATDLTTVTGTISSISKADGSGGVTPKMYSDALRVYNSNKIEFAVSSGHIVKIEFTTTQGTVSTSLFSSGSYSSNTWTPANNSTTSVILTNSTGSQIRWSTIKIYFAS